MKYRECEDTIKKRMYFTVLELHRRGFGYRKIQRIISYLYGLKISRSQISYWVRNIHRPFCVKGKNDDIDEFLESLNYRELEEYVNGNIKPKANVVKNWDSSSLAYLSGVLVGDGAIIGNSRFCLAAKDLEFVRNVSYLLSIILEKPHKLYLKGDGRYYIETKSQDLCAHLKENYLNYLHSNPIEFIKGYFDSEGSAVGYIDRKGFNYKIVTASTDREILKEIQLKLNDLDIWSKIYLREKAGTEHFYRESGWKLNKDYYSLEIRKKQSIILFHQKIGFTIPRKQKKLEDIVYLLNKYESNKERAIAWIQRYGIFPISMKSG